MDRPQDYNNVKELEKRIEAVDAELKELGFDHGLDRVRELFGIRGELLRARAHQIEFNKGIKAS